MTNQISTRLQGPFTFRDNTDFHNGWELASLDEVKAFFAQREWLLDQESWGNAYRPNLTDANGQGLWVIRGLRGGLQVLNEKKMEERDRAQQV